MTKVQSYLASLPEEKRALFAPVYGDVDRFYTVVYLIAKNEHLTDLVLDPIHEQIIKRVLAELQQFEAQGGVVSPEVKRQALETIQEHFDVIKQANPQKAAQLAQVLQQMVQPAQPPQPQIPQGGVQQVNGGQM